MTLVEGQRVRLVADLALGTASEGADGPVVGFLLLGAGVEGTVQRVAGEVPPPEEVREYERLRALFEDYGHTMPPETLGRLEAELAELEPHWDAFRARGARSSARVRFDNGFVLDEADEAVLAAL
ncbi:hypothetical protein [Streptomyces sp. TLI_171]|uniref:hypothetical protein n=1 Tax=Streptomyces sp. TLI_171 TaxID=1938859 RepID=UPI000C18B0B3|nr:hypothetical protein [Streptomyces sp. TLI_171]RKE18080.1 hypothetical protein BX266_1358 [Streptomyces sp. TLI_171]